MPALFTPAAPWTGKSATVDVQAVLAFLMRMERRAEPQFDQRIPAEAVS
jgi:hypothetical protein